MKERLKNGTKMICCGFFWYPVRKKSESPKKEIQTPCAKNTGCRTHNSELRLHPNSAFDSPCFLRMGYKIHVLYHIFYIMHETFGKLQIVKNKKGAVDAEKDVR